MARQRNKPADRALAVNPFRVMGVLERAAQREQAGHDVVHLEVGEPDFVTPEPIVAAGCRALQEGRTRYTPAAGLPLLRERIAELYAQRHGLSIDPARILVTPGASGALALLAQLLIGPGDGIAMADPGYPCNRNYVELVGGCPQLIPVTSDTAYQLTTAALDEACNGHTRGIWLGSPANPTGTTVDGETLSAISGWARERGMHLLVDEIYHGLVYGRSLPTALEAATDNIVVNSFSKYYGMTGWRVGWMVVPESLAERAEILAQNLFIAAPTAAQYAALRALDEDMVATLEERREAFQGRRDFLLPALRELGFTLPVNPAGAFYLYAGIEELAEDSEAFCHRLLEEQDLAVTPGTDFSEHDGRRHVRFAFTTGMDRLEKAVDRLARVLS